MMARIILLVVAVTMTATGIVFCSIAVFNLLLTVLSAAAAAALTAVLLFALVTLGILIRLATAQPVTIALPVVERPAPAQKSTSSQESIVSSLALLAREYPLIAVGCATALGIAEALNQKRK